MVRGHPLREDGAAAADDAGDALGDQRHILDEHAGVDGEVVDALLRLLFDDFEVDIDVEVFDALDAGQRLVQRHGADGHGRVAKDGSRIVGISPPVERSMTVSAPKWTAVCSLRSSSSMLEESAELPMLALILQSESTPMAIGSSSG